MNSEMRVLRLPTDLCAAAEVKFGHKFGTMEKLLEFVLRELVRDDAAQINQSEQRAVEERLRGLGYL